MCEDFEILHHSEHGYVVHCPCCSRFQVAFGNLLLSLTAEEYDRLFDALNAEQENISPFEEEHRKCAYLCTPLPSLRMTFTPIELKQFCGLLGQAQIMQQVNSWLGLENSDT